MTYVLATLAALLASESALRLPFDKSVKASLSTARKSAAVIRSPRISDHWKERVVPRYAAQLFRESLKLALMCSALLGIVALAVVVGYPLGQDVLHFLTTLQGLALVTAVSIAYLLLRSRLA